MNIRDLPVREYLVTANYPIEIRAGSDVGHTPHNGATRQIPNTQHLSTPSDGNTIPSGDTPTACARRFLAGLFCHTDGAVRCRGGGGAVDEDVGHVLVPGGVCPAARQPGLVIRPQPGHLLLHSAETACCGQARWNPKPLEVYPGVSTESTSI